MISRTRPRISSAPVLSLGVPVIALSGPVISNTDADAITSLA